MNIARLFSAHRMLESLLLREREDHLNHVAEIRAAYEQRLAALRGDLDEERCERRRLQDRLLQKNGALPVFEETPQRQGPPVVKTPQTRLERVVQRGQKEAETLYQDIEKHVKEQQEAAQAGAQ